MAQGQAKRSKLLALIEQNTWIIESFIALLKDSARKRPELSFYGRFADTLAESLSLVAIFKLRDPRSAILHFVMSYPMFNKVEEAYYHQIFKAVLDEMIEGEPNCIHRIGSSNFLKNRLIQMVLSRFNVEPYFIDFSENLKNAIENRTSSQS